MGALKESHLWCLYLCLKVKSPHPSCHSHVLPTASIVSYHSLCSGFVLTHPDKVISVPGHLFPTALSVGNGFGFVLMLCRNSLCRNKQYCKRVASLQEDVHALVQRLVKKACKHTDSAVALYYFRWVFIRSISADAGRSEQVWCVLRGLGSESLAEGLVPASVSYIRASQSWQSEAFSNMSIFWCLSLMASVVQKWSGTALLRLVGSAFLRLLLGVVQCVWFSGGWV